ncbi:hypothetical protein PoB_003951800 [Plakobranchus ocellatus]|uniref:Uncharacterized protein n=1 Tax=Plakobranchus ocellatus TaxID=259542 RepID=A0AAV4B0C7_9GAST|nr:hypothetical protein PoB_003951800 [Plakobranchus ocellatus]
MKTALIVCLGLSLLVAVFASSPPECISVQGRQIFSDNVCTDKTMTHDLRAGRSYCCEDSNLLPLLKMDVKDGESQRVCVCVTLQEKWCHVFPESCAA